MAYKSALDIIREHLPPEQAAKFHSNSRKPFDYEEPVLRVAMEAAEQIARKYGKAEGEPLFNVPYKSKIEQRFPNEGRRLFESEKPIVEAFNEKYKGKINV